MLFLGSFPALIICHRTGCQQQVPSLPNATAWLMIFTWIISNLTGPCGHSKLKPLNNNNQSNQSGCGKNFSHPVERFKKTIRAEDLGVNEVKKQ